jgi:hypothetical protein
VWEGRGGAGIIQGQFHGGDFMTIGVDGEMQLAPGAFALCS